MAKEIGTKEAQLREMRENRYKQATAPVIKTAATKATIQKLKADVPTADPAKLKPRKAKAAKKRRAKKRPRR